MNEESMLYKFEKKSKGSTTYLPLNYRNLTIRLTECSQNQILKTRVRLRV